jgi:hypothetical protein
VLAGTPRQQRVSCSLLRFLSKELRIAFVGVGVGMPGMTCCPMTSFAAGLRWNFRHGRWARICGIS